MCQLNNNELNSAYHWTKSQLIFFLFNWPIINWHGYNTLNNFMFNWPNINWHRYRPKGWKLSGCEEIITSFRIHGLDQLWLGSLWFGSRGESRQLNTTNSTIPIQQFQFNNSNWTISIEHVQYPIVQLLIGQFEISSISILFYCIPIFVELTHVQLYRVQLTNCPIRNLSNLILFNIY